MGNEGEIFMKEFLRKYSWLLASMIPEILILLCLSVAPITVGEGVNVSFAFGILFMMFWFKMPYVLIYFVVKIIFLFCAKRIFKIIDSKIKLVIEKDYHYRGNAIFK